MKNAFYLPTAKQLNDEGISKIIEKSALEGWVNNLPQVDVIITKDLLIDLIDKINATLLDAKKRVIALELLHEVRKASCQSLRMMVMGHGFPKTPKEHEILNYLTSIDRMFCIGYWCSVKTLSKKGITWLNKKHVVLAINRIIVGLSHIIVNHKIMHKEVPGLLWVDLHGLYALSVSLSLDSAKIDGSTMTIFENYKQILLFSLLDTSLLTASEIVDAFSIMREISPLVRIDDKPISGQKFQCIIPVSEDKPPFWLDSKSKPVDSKVLYIVSSGLSSFFSKKKKHISENRYQYDAVKTKYGYTGQISTELMHYLELMLYGEKFVGTPLFHDRLPRFVGIGLSNAAILKDNQIVGDNQYEHFCETASGSTLIFNPQQGEKLSVGTVISFRREDSKVDVRGLGIVKRILVSTNRLFFEISLLTLDYNVFFIKKNVREGLQENLIHSIDQNTVANNVMQLSPENAIPLLSFNIKNQQSIKNYILCDFFIQNANGKLMVYLNNKPLIIYIVNEPIKVGLGCWQYEYLTEENFAKTR